MSPLKSLLHSRVWYPTSLLIGLIILPACSTKYPIIVCPEVQKPMQSELYQDYPPLPALRSLPESKLSPVDSVTP